MEMARSLDEARNQRTAREKLTASASDLSLEDAYKIQSEGLKLRLNRGEKIIGYKMGLTSKAKMEQMGLHSPIYGVLTDRMQVANQTFNIARAIHPKIEPEIAFRIGKELKGQVTADEALSACDGVCAALEILDSRFLNFKYFSLPDVVADNCSSSHFVLAPQWLPPNQFALADLELKMSINGKTAQKGFSNAVLGNPLNSLAQLSAMLDQQGLSLKPGAIVLTGAVTLAEALAPGMNVRLEIAGMPTAEIEVSGEKS